MGTTNQHQQCLQAAIEYQQLGWSAIQVCPPDHQGVSKAHADFCQSPGKAPMTKWKDFQSRQATTGELQTFWSRCPAANVGIVTGRVSSIVAIDVDGRLGHETLLRLSEGDLPDTIVFDSGRDDSYRLIYSLAGYGGPVPTIPIEIAGQQCLKILGDGAQTVAPPSRHHTGQVYQWRKGRSHVDRNPAKMPRWLSDMLRNHNDAQTGLQQPQRRHFTGNDPIPVGSRDTVLTQIAGSARRFGASYDAILAMLRIENEKRCVNELGEPDPLPDRDLQKIARSIANKQPHEATASRMYEFARDLHAQSQTQTATQPAPEAGHPPIAPQELDYSRIVFEYASDIEERDQDWLWRGWIPLDGITILEGTPGIGKSQFSIDISARITRGDVMPDGTPGLSRPAKVIIMACEDRWETQIKPRLIAARAVLPNVIAIKGLRRADGEVEFPELDKKFARQLKAMVIGENVKLITIDPLSAYMPADVDMHKEKEVRKGLQPLLKVISDTGCANLSMRHMPKTSSGNSMNRGGGSYGIAALARSGIVLDKHPDEPNVRVVAVFKGSYDEEKPAMDYQLVTDPQSGRPHISYIGPSLVDHDDLAFAASDPKTKKQAEAKKHQAVDLIQRMIPPGGSATASDVYSNTRRLRISDSTVRDAARELGIRVVRSTLPNSNTPIYIWRMPADQ